MSQEPKIHLLSRHYPILPRRNRKQLWNYVVERARQPDIGSKFDLRTRWLRRLPERPMFWGLRLFRYDAGLLEDDGKWAGSCFFQRHGDELHLFSVQVEGAFRGRGFCTRLIKWMIEHGISLPGVRWVRIGAGGNPASEHIYREKLPSYEATLGFRLRGAGWIELLDKCTQPQLSWAQKLRYGWSRRPPKI